MVNAAEELHVTTLLLSDSTRVVESHSSSEFACPVGDSCWRISRVEPDFPWHVKGTAFLGRDERAKNRQEGTQ